jgi:hypothetical protein
VLTAVHVSASLHRHRDPKKPVPKVPMPWDEDATASDVTDDERAVLREQLRRRSAFAD